MIRKKLFRAVKQPALFRERGKEILRIEALSDAVFAFSVSLLVVALEVPQNFEELRTILQGAIPFFATVAMIFLFWYQQYKFFRRYGLNDKSTILLNLAYLAVILFYVYPMKFLFSLLLGSWTGIDLFPKAAEKGIAVIYAADFPQLIVLFSAGYTVIWLLIYGMYRRAGQYHQQLELSTYEIKFTGKEKRGALWNLFIGVAAIVMALAGMENIAGICYLFIPVLLILNEKLFKKSLQIGKKETQKPHVA